MQDLSYTIDEPRFQLGQWILGFRVYTFENVYTLRPKDCCCKNTTDVFTMQCTRFNYAGNRLHIDGNFQANIAVTMDGIRISATCSMPDTIRSIKVSIFDLPLGDIVNLREGIVPIPAEGSIYTYPSGWRGLYTPIVVIKNEQKTNSFFYFRSLDYQVREKRFAFLPHDENVTVELIHEETGSKMSSSVQIPDWEIGICKSPDVIYEKQRAHIETSYQIPQWDVREDVPKWLRKIALVASIHMEHWSGYTFHTYKQVTETARWISQRINPEHVLLYLPGWDGRYYWKYGTYSPSDSMGGENVFCKMLAELKNMGFHIMLMVGMNMAARHIENFQQWGATSLSTNVSGIPQYTLVDWDGSRHYQHNFNAMLNIGAPHWQKKLTEEILRLYNDYEYDAMFLDISAAWTNEALFDNFTGICTFVKTLRKSLPPQVLIAGEGWYDGLGAITPLVQSGHTEGVLHWHDEPWCNMFDPYCRCFGHLCLGDPGRGSTGVHELGYNSIRTVPYRKGVIPTVTFVEDTLDNAAAQVENIICTAKAYINEFL